MFFIRTIFVTLTASILLTSCGCDLGCDNDQFCTIPTTNNPAITRHGNQSNAMPSLAY